MIMGKTAVKGPKGVKSGSEITEELLETLSVASGGSSPSKDEKDAAQVEALNEQYEAQKRALDTASRTRSRRCAAATTCRRA
jgi:DNA-directed RNA polymerase subunit beta